MEGREQGASAQKLDATSNSDGGDAIPFYILSIDGGGFRGAFAAHVLRRIEEETKAPWTRAFDMFAGTSTGSILAAGLATGMSAATLADFYATHGKAIFTPRLRSRLDLLKLVTSRYSSNTLRGILENEFGKTTLGQVQVPLLMPSVDIGNGCVHVFKSRYADFIRDPGVRLSDAVLASCSAPTFFDPRVVDNKYHLADGGLWANNPSLAAVIDARYRLNVPLENIRVLSIGTGKSNTFYTRSGGKWHDRLIRSWQGWGIATRWQRSKLLDLILNLQSDAAHNMLCLLLGETPAAGKNVYRLTFESDTPLPMDATTRLPDWISQADMTFTHNATRIIEFLRPSGVAR